MTYNNIEGKFYPLQRQEFLMSRKELTPAQRDVFCLLKIINPFSDRFTNISIKEIAEELELSKRTVSNALKVLYQLGWIDLELVSADFRVCPCTNNDDKSGRKFPSLEKSPQVLEKSPQVLEKSPQIEQLKPSPGKGFKISKTNKTNKTNKISLSEEEREKFLEFAMRKAGELPNPPTLPKKWINRNYDELWAEYEELERHKEANKRLIKESIKKPQETVLDPLFAAGLASGQILEIDRIFKMLKDANGHWHHFSDWVAVEKPDFG